MVIVASDSAADMLNRRQARSKVKDQVEVPIFHSGLEKLRHAQAFSDGMYLLLMFGGWYSKGDCVR